MMLLYATHDLLLHLLLYHQSLRRRRAVRETLLSKLKLLLFLFFLLINCFKMMRLIHLQTIFLPAAAGNVTFYHLDTLTHSFSHYTQKQTHHKIQDAVYTQSTSICFD